MNPDHETLLAIQDRDRRILELRQSLERIPSDRERAKTRLEDDQAAVAAAKEVVTANEIATKNLELDIQTRQDSITKLKTQQFQTRKNEEFQAMGTEIERYQIEINELEERELVLMEELEQLRENLQGAQRGLARTQELVDEEIAALDTRGTEAGQRITQLEEEVQNLKVKLDEDLVDTYERTFKSKGDYAIVEIRHGVCDGCHMKIPPDNMHRAKSDTDTVFCINCGRIVYVLA
jgi:predicted  nucleic acid-binding Zn-ribbon protein